MHSVGVAFCGCGNSDLLQGIFYRKTRLDGVSSHSKL